MPLTAAGVVDKIVTEMGVFIVTPEGIAVEEIHPDYTFEEVQEATEARLIYHN